MDISVIIPIYNISEYLIPCLDSVAKAIGDLEVEVLLIDDESTDDSGILAEAYTKKDPRFVYFRKENGGPGSARNFGVQKATGEYLMFIDSDDLVEPDIFTKLFALAEKTQSEITICNEARINSKGTKASTLSQRVYSGLADEETTHITRNRSLFYDTIVTDKLILRSFYLKHAFMFPEKMVFEDIPVAMKMHLLANRVAFLKKTEYLWRIRDGETKSVTQRNAETSNLHNRLTVLESVFDFFRSTGEPGFLEQLQIKTLKVDLMLFVDVLSEISDEQASEYMVLLNGFVDAHIDKEAVKKLPVTQRQKYRYLFERDLDGIRKTIDYHNRKHSGTKVIKQENGYVFDLPKKLFTEEDLSVDNDYVDTYPNCSVDSMSVNRNVLEIRAHLFDPKIPVETEQDLQLKINLIGDIHKARIPVRLIREKGKRVTERYGVVFNENTQELDRYSYECAGFLLRVDLNSLGELSIPADNYFFECTYKTSIRDGCCVLQKAMERYYDKYRNSLFEAGESQITINFDPAKQLYLHVEKAPHAGEMPAGRDNRWRFWKSGVNNRTELIRDEKNAFVFSGKDNTGKTLLTGKESMPVWRITNAVGKRLEYEFELYSRSKGIREVEIYADDTATGNRQVLSHCLLHRRGKRYFGDGAIEMNSLLLDSLNIGEHTVYAVWDDGRGEELLSMEQFDHEMAFASMSLYFLGEASGRSVLRVFNDWPAEEKTKAERTYIRKVEYKQFRKEPLEEKTVLFESNGGEGFGGGPGEIYETIRKNHPDYTCVWSLRNPRMPAEGDPVRVRKGSRDYYHYLATAKTMVTDTGFGGAFRKRGDQVLVQSPQDLPDELK